MARNQLWRKNRQGPFVSRARAWSIYRKLGRYAEAEPLYKRSITILEELWGRDSIEVARDLNSLALAYYNQAKYSEAVPINRSTISTKQMILMLG